VESIGYKVVLSRGFVPTIAKTESILLSSCCQYSSKEKGILMTNLLAGIDSTIQALHLLKQTFGLSWGLDYGRTYFHICKFAYKGVQMLPISEKRSSQCDADAAVLAGSQFKKNLRLFGREYTCMYRVQ